MLEKKFGGSGKEKNENHKKNIDSSKRHSSHFDGI
jgi:hypothetical protein